MIRRKPSEPFTLVWRLDDAIDRDSLEGKVAVVQYVRERDPSVLRMRPGAEPTRFRCRPLSRGARLFVESAESEAMRNALSFMCGVIGITGLPEPWVAREVPAGWGESARVLDPKCLDELEELIPAAAIDEIGAWILERSRLGVPEKKVSSPPSGSPSTESQES